MNTLHTNSRKDALAEQKTAKWLKENGISEKEFMTNDIWLLQANKAAHNLLKKHIDKLNDKDQNILMNYCYVMMDSTQRNKITKRMSYEVMNINKKVRRNEFTTIKQTKKAKQLIQAKRQVANKA